MCPWEMSSASAHTKKANTSAKKKQWSSTANAVLEKTGDDAKAIKIANAAVKKHPSKKKPKAKKV
jgi:hypothetical protein